MLPWKLWFWRMLSLVDGCPACPSIIPLQFFQLHVSRVSHKGTNFVIKYYYTWLIWESQEEIRWRCKGSRASEEFKFIGGFVIFSLLHFDAQGEGYTWLQRWYDVSLVLLRWWLVIECETYKSDLAGEVHLVHVTNQIYNITLLLPVTTVKVTTPNNNQYLSEF